MGDSGKTLHPKKAAFLAAYSEVGNITQAAEIAGIARTTHYDWMRDDPDYPALFRQAEEHACDRLEQEARRRAVHGVDKPVFYQGQECGKIREYSDTLLIFLMKGNLPHKYKERVENEHTGKDGKPMEMNVQISRIAGMSDDELKKILGGESGE